MKIVIISALIDNYYFFQVKDQEVFEKQMSICDNFFTWI